MIRDLPEPDEQWETAEWTRQPGLFTREITVFTEKQEWQEIPSMLHLASEQHTVEKRSKVS